MVADGKKIYNPQSVALNQIQVTPAYKKYYDVDIDFKDGKGVTAQELMFTLTEGGVLNYCAFSNNIVKTKGGFHILVELDKIEPECKKQWFNKLKNLKHPCFDVMLNGDNMIPFPGCVQADSYPMLL